MKCVYENEVGNEHVKKQMKGTPVVKNNIENTMCYYLFKKDKQIPQISQ